MTISCKINFQKYTKKEEDGNIQFSETACSRETHQQKAANIFLTVRAGFFLNKVLHIYRQNRKPPYNLTKKPEFQTWKYKK